MSKPHRSARGKDKRQIAPCFREDDEEAVRLGATDTKGRLREGGSAGWLAFHVFREVLAIGGSSHRASSGVTREMPDAGAVIRSWCMARGHEHEALGVSTDATFRSPVRLREVLENLPDLVLVLDRKGRIRYVNAGHPPGYVLNRSGAVKRRLENTALPLAVSAETKFVEGEPVALEPGDMIVLLTDGVHEAFSPRDELFGMDRTLELLRAHRRKSARQLIEMLYGAVREFAGGRELQDDITAVIIKVLPQGRPGRRKRSGPRRDGNPDPSRRSG